jgi:hypothetical protein
MDMPPAEPSHIYTSLSLTPYFVSFCSNVEAVMLSDFVS